MKLSKIFEDKPKRWGFRGDPYFWDYLKELAEDMDIISPDELERWIKEEYFSLSGKALTDEYGDFAVIKQFAHGGMSSGGVDNKWWMEEGIPLLKSRLTALGQLRTACCENSANNRPYTHVIVPRHIETVTLITRSGVEATD